MATPYTTDVDRIRFALYSIPADDRETWIRIGMAIKSEFGDAGFDLWDEWSQQASSYNTRDSRSVWKSIHNDGEVRLGTLFYMARQNGWRDGHATSQSIAKKFVEQLNAGATPASQELEKIEWARTETATWAARIWSAAMEAKVDHPYLASKEVLPVTTLREIDAAAVSAILPYIPKSGGVPLEGRLLVVPVKVGTELSTLELIDIAGRKTALAGNGTKASGYWATQRLPEDQGQGVTLLIGEGVATVLSVRQVTGANVVATLSSTNLLAVAQVMRERFPSGTLVVLADLNKKTPDVNREFCNVDQAPDLLAEQAAVEVFERLAVLQPAPDGEPIIWRFDSAAQALFATWLVSLETELRSDELNPALVSHLAKYRKLVPSLALLFALVDTPCSEGLIGEREVARAIAWAQYLRTHANRLYSFAVIPETTGAVALLNKVQMGAPGNEFTARRVAQNGWTRLNSVELVRKAADILVEYGWLRRDRQKTGGRSSDRYIVNPAAFDQGTPVNWSEKWKNADSACYVYLQNLQKGLL